MSGRHGGSAPPDTEHLDPRKVRLMELTEELLARHGFDGLRLRDVSNRAGVSVGSIQHWFETRDALVLETLLAFKRAGCAGVLTYHAPVAARLLGR